MIALIKLQEIFSPQIALFGFIFVIGSFGWLVPTFFQFFENMWEFCDSDIARHSINIYVTRVFAVFFLFVCLNILLYLVILIMFATIISFWTSYPYRLRWETGYRGAIRQSWPKADETSGSGCHYNGCLTASSDLSSVYWSNIYIFVRSLIKSYFERKLLLTHSKPALL